jgi:hypothetical protein
MKRTLPEAIGTVCDAAQAQAPFTNQAIFVSKGNGAQASILNLDSEKVPSTYSTCLFPVGKTVADPTCLRSSIPKSTRSNNVHIVPGYRFMWQHYLVFLNPIQVFSS